MTKNKPKEEKVRLRRLTNRQILRFLDMVDIFGWIRLPVIRIKINDLWAVQPRVKTACVRKYLRSLPDYPPVFVLKTKKKLVLWDGTHRVHALLNRRRKFVWAKLYELKP